MVESLWVLAAHDTLKVVWATSQCNTIGEAEQLASTMAAVGTILNQSQYWEQLGSTHFPATPLNTITRGNRGEEQEQIQ